MKVEEIPEHDSSFDSSEGENLRNGWLIISPAKSFAVYAQTALEKQEWMTHMNRCIDEEKRKAGGYYLLHKSLFVVSVASLSMVGKFQIKYNM